MSRENSRSVISGERCFETLHVSESVVLRVSNLAIVGTVKNHSTWRSTQALISPVSTRDSGQLKIVYLR